MNDNQAGINGMLGINPSEKVDLGENEDEDTEYYKSVFTKANGSYDDVAMRANSEKIALQTAVEGSVLLWYGTIKKPYPLSRSLRSIFSVCQP